MADKKKQQEEEVLVDVGASISKAEQFVESNQKTITYIVGGLIVIVGGIWAYFNWYLNPREAAAQEEMVKAVMAFEKDSLQSAINGAGNWSGFAEIAETYSGTKSGNISHFYAGISHLNLGQYQEAIMELDKFSPKDDVFKTLKFGAIADAFLENNQPKDALDYYTKSVSGSNNNFLTPFFLKKAGLTAEILEEYGKAGQFYQRIADEFPDSREANDALKYVERAQAHL